MKKLILALGLLLAFTGHSFSQTQPAKPKKTTTAPAKTTSSGTPAKKDGTPDMRYKANKDAAAAKPATTHVKKDGTPDKRYKENKK